MSNLLGGSAVCIVGAVLVVGFIFLVNAIRIVPEYQRLVVFRLGRSIGSKGPGIVFLIPVIDRAVKVDLREQVREVLIKLPLPKTTRRFPLTSSGITRCWTRPSLFCRLEILSRRQPASRQRHCGP